MWLIRLDGVRGLWENLSLFCQISAGEKEALINISFMLLRCVFALQRQGSGAAAGNNKTSGEQGKKRKEIML